jgi:SnoaL-like domain
VGVTLLGRKVLDGGVMTLSSEDRLEVLELAARYNHAFDQGDAEAFANTWTDDGVFEFVTRHTVRGRSELLGMPKTSAERGWTVRHWTTNPVIDGDGNEATLKLYVMVMRIDAEGRHIEGKWKFIHRCLTPDGP